MPPGVRGLLHHDQHFESAAGHAEGEAGGRALRELGQNEPMPDLADRTLSGGMPGLSAFTALLWQLHRRSSSYIGSARNGHGPLGFVQGQGQIPLRGMVHDRQRVAIGRKRERLVKVFTVGVL